MRWFDWLHPGKDDADPVAVARAEEAERLRLERGDLDQLDTVFAPPPWLADIGRSSWFLVGFVLLIVGLVWLMAATYTIVGPVVAGTVIATVTMPLVSTMHRHRIPRAAGAALVLLAVLALAVGMLVLVLAGIKDQSGAVSNAAHEAASKVQKWLEDAGVNHGSAQSANSSVSASVPQTVKTLSHGIVSGIRGIASLAFALSFLFLSTFFLLKDGPMMRRVVDRHLGVPAEVGHTITGGVIRSLRGYFRGVTIVSAFNGIVIGLGALVLGVPMAGTIGIVNFVLAYIPYIGAIAGGAFAVVIALGAKGTTTALIMLVLVILANGLLQNIVQPFAMGSALQLNPLVVLIVTIGSGCLFGTIGLILAAPLVSAAVHIKAELDEARLAAAAEAAPAPLPEPG